MPEKSSNVLRFPTGFEPITCCVCQIEFCVTAAFKNARLNDYTAFYCPVGHGQSYKNPKPMEEKKKQDDEVAVLSKKIEKLEKQVNRRAWWRK